MVNTVLRERETKGIRSSKRRTDDARVDVLNDRAWEMRIRDPETAKGIAEEAVTLAREVGYDIGAARGLGAIAYAETVNGSAESAWTAVDEALSTARRTSDALTEGRALYLQGVLFRRTGNAEEAITSFERSLDIATALGERELEAFVFNSIANLHAVQGESEQALRYFTQSRKVAMEIGDPDAEARAVYGIGTLLVAEGKYKDALEMFEASRRLSETSQNGKAMVIAVIHGVASCHRYLGDISLSLQEELDALRRAEELGIWESVVASLYNIGHRYLELGEYALALNALLRCLDAARDHGAREEEGICMTLIGDLYKSMGELHHALEYSLQGLQIARDVKAHDAEASALLNLGNCYRDCGEGLRALTFYLRCLEMLKKQSHPHLERGVLEAIGRTYVLLGESDEARSFIQKSLDLARSIEDRTEEIGSLQALSELDRTLGNRESAREHLERALAISRETGHNDHRLSLLKALAELCREMGDPVAASSYAQEREDLSGSIFNSETTRRVKSLIEQFEASYAQQEARRLGLNDESLERIRQVAHERDVRLRATKGEERDLLSLGRTAVNGSTNGRHDGSQPKIRITTFGAFRVEINGTAVPKTAWTRKRARDLFKLLLANHRQTVTVDDIEDKLWGKRVEKIESLVMNAASHVRSALGLCNERAEGAPSLTRVDNGYLLDLGDSHLIDFVRFKELIVAARRSEKANDREQLYAQAVALYHGEFLPEDMFVEWTDYQRQMLKDAWFEAAEYLARERLRSGDVDSAIEQARAILRLDEVSESAWYVLLRALHQSGRRTEMRRAYEQCVERYREFFEEEPPATLRRMVETSAA